MVSLTENAASEIKRQLAGGADAGDRVRIGLEAGGCSGTKYVITPGAAARSDDVTDRQFGLTILVDPANLAAIKGLKIDFVDALMGGGFQFDNPNAARTCGCGASFTAAEPDQVNNA